MHSGSRESLKEPVIILNVVMDFLQDLRRQFLIVIFDDVLWSKVWLNKIIYYTYRKVKERF